MIKPLKKYCLFTIPELNKNYVNTRKCVNHAITIILLTFLIFIHFFNAYVTYIYVHIFSDFIVLSLTLLPIKPFLEKILGFEPQNELIIVKLYFLWSTKNFCK